MRSLCLVSERVCDFEKILTRPLANEYRYIAINLATTTFYIYIYIPHT